MSAPSRCRHGTFSYPKCIHRWQGVAHWTLYQKGAFRANFHIYEWSFDRACGILGLVQQIGICYVGSSSTHRPTFLHRRFTMLERFFKSQVATVSDSTYCHRITDALTAAGIKCYCKTKDVNQRSVFDATRMRAQIGTFGIKPRYITEIFVDKENAELASHIIHTL